MSAVMWDLYIVYRPDILFCSVLVARLEGYNVCRFLFRAARRSDLTSKIEQATIYHWCLLDRLFPTWYVARFELSFFTPDLVFVFFQPEPPFDDNIFPNSGPPLK